MSKSQELFNQPKGFQINKQYLTMTMIDNDND